MKTAKQIKAKRLYKKPVRVIIESFTMQLNGTMTYDYIRLCTILIFTLSLLRFLYFYLHSITLCMLKFMLHLKYAIIFHLMKKRYMNCIQMSSNLTSKLNLLPLPGSLSRSSSLSISFSKRALIESPNPVPANFLVSSL